MAHPVSPLAPKSYPELPEIAGVRFATAGITPMPPQTRQHFETGQNLARSHRCP